MTELSLEERRRHTASHVLSYAVGMAFGQVKRGVGPHTDTGFYQDFDFGDAEVSDKDFKKIEKKMRWIVNKNFKVERVETDPTDARAYFAHDEYKLELIDEIVARGEVLTFHNFVNENGEAVYQDLCMGGHLESTGQLGVFKLTKLAGAYWRGDSERTMMNRVYGVAFADEEALAEYQEMMAQAAARDHRKLGAELDLFTFSDKVGSGLPMFTPKGAFMRNQIKDTIMEIQGQYGYEEVYIPHITKKELYETSGHWDKFKEDLFHVKGKGDTQFVMKPMNCPHHTQIYASQMRSYRDLPIRYAETTTCYRDELPGELLGLSRVRALTQDDGHAFCTIEQVGEEVQNLVKVVREFYSKLGMWNEDSFWVSLSVRDGANKEKYLGKDEHWDMAEDFLESVAQGEKLPYKRVEGEAAFYGPKLDFQFKDAIGREWQLATIQIDFVQPERFGLEYVNHEGNKERPVMIHRAIAGSLERFMSVIIEHFAGAFPAWLAPVQAHILPVNQAHEDFAYNLAEKLKDAGVEVQSSGDSLGKRIRNSQTKKIPYTLVVGDNEVNSGKVNVRAYGQEKDETMGLEQFIQFLNV